MIEFDNRVLCHQHYISPFCIWVYSKTCLSPTRRYFHFSFLFVLIYSKKTLQTKTKAKTRYLKAKKGRRKRRKTGEAPPRLNGDDHESSDEEAVDNVQDDEPAEEHRSQTPQAALPSFPRPVAPDAPSKSTLALQGVDKALLGAELIDPSRTLPLDAFTPAPGEIPVLSDRMKKRLMDLGIVELFAGAWYRFESSALLSTPVFSADCSLAILTSA